MNQHELKCYPEFFNKIISGEKSWELRKNDRDFKEGDILILNEWNPDTQEYTGQVYSVICGYILYGGKFGLPEDMCIITIITPLHLDALDLHEKVGVFLDEEGENDVYGYEEGVYDTLSWLFGEADKPDVDLGYLEGADEEEEGA